MRREWHHARCGIIRHLYPHNMQPNKIEFWSEASSLCFHTQTKFVWNIISTGYIHCRLFVWAENIISIVNAFYFLFVWAENIISTENVQRASHIWSQWHLIVFTLFSSESASGIYCGEIDPTHNTTNYNTQKWLFQIQKEDSGERSFLTSEIWGH